MAAGLVAGTGYALAGCAGARRDGAWPGATWADADPSLAELPCAVPDASGQVPEGAVPCTAALAWATPRARWTSAPPDRSDINPMLPIEAVTVHHDGLEDLIETTAPAAMAARIERYRVGHRARGWADIGYHLVIDRGGILWEGRSVEWQGAHVKDHNEGNIGVLVMGNFEVQRPTSAQLATLDRVLADLMTTYGVAPRRVLTHREWPGARTACPGRHLQPRVEAMRLDGGRLAPFA